MKNLLLSIALVLSLQTFSQTDKETVKAEILTYFSMVENNDTDGIINYMHPKVFETVSKEQLKQGMEQMLKNEQMEIEFLTTDLSNISDTIEHKGSKYCLIDYSNNMRMTFLSEKDKPLEEKKVFIDFMKSTLDTQFGAENVKAEVETASLSIYVKSNIYAIYNEGFKGWKFLANDTNMKAVTDTVIPVAVQEQLFEDK